VWGIGGLPSPVILRKFLETCGLGLDLVFTAWWGLIFEGVFWGWFCQALWAGLGVRSFADRKRYPTLSDDETVGKDGAPDSVVLRNWRG